MGVVEQLVSAVQASQKMEQGKKEVVVGFLQAAGPTLEVLGSDGFSAVVESLAQGSTGAEAVAAQLSAAQVASLLEVTEQQMSVLAVAHGVEVKAAEAAIAQLESAA
ncbi:MAG TPA: hypothetical protein VHM90_20350, partial [Phycisphaerae bacterium]|nr:hypothetical protein [Phycisphaerae bacterium]